MRLTALGGVLAFLLALWSPSSGTFCRSPPRISYGRHDGGYRHYFRVGQVVTYRCHYGYKLEGESKITCISGDHEDSSSSSSSSSDGYYSSSSSDSSSSSSDSSSSSSDSSSDSSYSSSRRRFSWNRGPPNVSVSFRKCEMLQ